MTTKTKFKSHNPYLNHYKNNANPLITDHNHICVLLETTSRYKMEYAPASINLIQDYLNEIVLALFDTHFRDKEYPERRLRIMHMFDVSFANAVDFYEEDESESA